METLKINANNAENRLNLEENVLGNMMNVIHRVQELQVQSGNSVLGKGDREAIIQEMEQLRDELVGLANTQDANGEYLFSGFQTNTKPFVLDASGNYVYNGDAGQRFLQIESSSQVIIADSGFDFFVNIPNGNGDFQISDPGAANTGSGVISPGSIFNQSAYVKDTYTITFVTNSSGQLAYQVVGAATGQIIPALPATIPDDAPAFLSGQSIQFNGIEVAITGTPVAGDNFQIAPSTRQSLFDTVADMIEALGLPIETEAQRAIATNRLSQSFTSLEQAVDNILSYRAEIGARLNQIDHARDVSEDFSLHTVKIISQIEDLDYAKAISELQLQSTALEAAQRSFIQIKDLTLFNFLR